MGGTGGPPVASGGSPDGLRAAQPQLAGAGAVGGSLRENISGGPPEITGGPPVPPTGVFRTTAFAPGSFSPGRGETAWQPRMKRVCCAPYGTLQRQRQRKETRRTPQENRTPRARKEHGGCRGKVALRTPAAFGRPRSFSQVANSRVAMMRGVFAFRSQLGLLGAVVFSESAQCSVLIPSFKNKKTEKGAKKAGRRVWGAHAPRVPYSAPRGIHPDSPRPSERLWTPGVPREAHGTARGARALPRCPPFCFQSSGSF